MPRTPVNELSKREREVAECIAAGMSDAEILAAKSITLWQLRNAIKGIYHKSEAQCVRALVVWCQRATVKNVGAATPNVASGSHCFMQQ